MSLESKYRVITDSSGEKYSTVEWYSDSDWFQTDSRTAWKKSFILFPRKSCLSYKRIWGKCCKRTVKYMCKMDDWNGIMRDTEYATLKETFEDKLKGAL